MKINGVFRSMTAKERRAALNAIRKVEHQLGVAQFGWAVRKHMAIAALKRTTERRVKEMRREIAKLENCLR